MKAYSLSFLIVLVLLPALSHSQPAAPVIPLDQVIEEVLQHNPEIRAAGYQRELMHARAGQAAALDDPELMYMREEMPGFRWNAAMMQKIGLEQRIRFPSKLFSQGTLAGIQTEHAHHDHLEKVNEVIARTKTAYYELWFIQQSIDLNMKSAALLQQMIGIAQTRYTVGEAAQQDVLKGYVELARIENRLVTFRQQEMSMKAMLMAILYRSPQDTLGTAVLADNVVHTPSLDTLEALALRFRPMLLHDSLAVEEMHTMRSLAKQEYLPDLKLGVEYVASPQTAFNGWSVKAGITLPFAPWTLGKASSRVEEASVSISKAQAVYAGSRAMVISNIRDLHFKTRSAARQLETYRTLILPQAQLSLEATLTAYQTGKSDFLMLIDAYRTLVDLQMESLMTRMQFEQSVAELERAVGYNEHALWNSQGTHQ
jgi:cobalt-zinc-cadmium efflux system outer membrane protein